MTGGGYRLTVRRDGTPDNPWIGTVHSRWGVVVHRGYFPSHGEAIAGGCTVVRVLSRWPGRTPAAAA